MMEDLAALTPNIENIFSGLLKSADLNRRKWYSPCNSPFASSRAKSPESDLPSLKLAHFAKIPRISFGNVQVGCSKSKRLIVRNPNPLPQTLTFEKAASSKGFLVSSEHSSDENPSSKLTVEIEPDDDVVLAINWEPKEHGSCREIIRFMWEDSLRLQVIVFGTAIEPSKVKRKSASVLQPSQALNKSHQNVIGKRSKDGKTGFRHGRAQDIPIFMQEDISDEMVGTDEPDSIVRRGTFVIKKGASKENILGKASNQSIKNPVTNVGDDSYKCKEKVDGSQHQIQMKKDTPEKPVEATAKEKSFSHYGDGGVKLKANMSQKRQKTLPRKRALGMTVSLAEDQNMKPVNGPKLKAIMNKKQQIKSSKPKELSANKGFLTAKKPKRKLKLKLAAKGVPQKRLKLVKTVKSNIPRHPMPFAAKNMYYDERWIEKQQEGFTRWLNFVLTPPDCDTPSHDSKRAERGSVPIGGTTKKSQPLAPTKEVLSLRAYTARRRMARLRRCACLLYQSEPLACIIQKVESEVEAGRLAIRADRKLHADLGIKRYVVEMLLSYNPLWLRIGLEVIYGEILPLISNDDVSGLSRFIADRLLGNPDIAREFAHPKVPGLYRQGYVERLCKFTMKKFLFLVLFMDRAKLTKLIDHDPVLFNKDAPFKSSRSLLLAFSREFLKGEGDITKHLYFLGYAVTHSQTALEEYDYAVTNIATDLRDGLRLTRVAELLMQKWNLCSGLRVPAISRLQKIHNVELFLKALKERGVSVNKEGLDARHVVDGHREKTLALLWQLIFHFQVNVLLSDKQLKEEICYLEQNKELRFQLTAAMAWAEQHASIFDGRRQSTDVYFNSERLRLLLKWCKTVCGLYGMKIDNFTVSFSDGRAMCYLLHHYHPSLLPLGLIRQQTTMTCNPGLQESDSEEESLGPDVWTASYSPGSGVNHLLERLMSNERENFRLLAEKVKELGGVPLMTKTADMSNTIPDEKVVITYVSYLCARVLDLREETRAARCIQTVWRRYRLRKQLAKRQEAAKAAVVLQAYARSAAMRRRFRNMKNAAVHIQAVYRGHLARKLLTLQELSAEHIQAAFQAWRLGRAVRQRFLNLRRTVIAMQAIVRGSQARKLCSRMRAATTVQACWRGYVARRRFLALRAAAVVVQRSSRERRQLVCVRNAVLSMQRRYRAVVLCRLDREDYLQLRRSVITVQSVYRGNRDRTVATRIRATVVIQSRVRTWKAREKYLHMRNAVVKIQAQVRGRLVRRRYVTLKEAACVLQRRVRAFSIAQRQRDEYLQLRSACVVIQTEFRGFSQRRVYLRYREAAVVVQAYTRMHLARARYTTLKASAVTIQRRFKAYLLSKGAAEEFQRMRMAATKIQATFRGRKCQKEFARAKRAAVTIQSHTRRWLRRSEFLSARSAAFVLQARYRAVRRGRMELRQYHIKRGAIITLQAAVRGHLVRDDLKRRNQAAGVIQAGYRSYSTRKRFLALKKSAVVLQRRYRALQEGRVVAAAYQRLRRAAVRMQSAIRAHRARKLMKVLRAAVLIQAYYKGYRERKSYQSARRSIIKAQAFTRGRVTRRSYKKLREAAIITQRRYRARVVGNQQRRRFCAERSACVSIQAALRGSFCRRTFLQLKSAAVVIQRRHRALTVTRKQRQRYLTLKACAVQLQAGLRGWKSRKLAKQHRAARAIQAAYRMYTTHREYKTYREAVIKVQSLTRMKQQRASFVTLRMSAVVIQTRFRAAVLSRQHFEAYHVIRGAVITLQAGARGFLVRQSLRKMNESAVKIQSTFRCYIIRQRYNRTKLAALTIQLRYRAFLLGRGVEANYRRLRWAAVVLQAWYRGHRVRCATRRIRAAIVIQSVCRSYVVRSQFQTQRRSVLVIQTAIRKHQARAKFLSLRNAVLVLQRRFRAKQAMERTMIWYRTQRHACVTLQAAMRCWLQRRQYTSLKRSAMTIQRHYRAWTTGAHAREEYLRLKSAAVIVQSAYRAWKARELIERMRAAIKLQSLYRMYVVRRRYLKLLGSTVKLQAVYRKNHASRAYRSMRCAALVIQRRFRAHQLRESEREAYLEMRAAVVVIQSFYRGQRARSIARNIREEMKRREAAACKIQCFYRSYCLMKSAYVEYHITRGAFITIQSYFRGYQARRLVCRIRAAVKIQALYRGVTTRLRYVHLRRSVIGLQALVRCNQTQRWFVRLRQAAVVIQRHYRANQISRQTQHEYWTLKRATVLIQSAFKGLQQRRRYCILRRVVISTQALVRCNQTQRRFLRLRQAAVVIQRRYRANELSRQTQHEYMRLKQATLLTQSAFRGLQQRRRYCILRRVVISTQALVRCNQTQRRFLRLRQAAVVIQRRYRANELSRQTQHEYMRLKQATLLTQSAFRGLQQRRRYCILRRVVISTQALVRCNQTQRRFLRLRQAALVIQRRYRANELCRQTQHEYMRLKQATLLTQSAFRGLQQRRRYCILRRVVISTQALVRCNQTQRRFLRLRQAALVIQRRYRANELCRQTQHEYMRLKQATLLTQSAFRGLQQRRRYRLVRRVVISTQALVRCNQTQRRFLRLRQAALVIQRRYRANELSRQTQHEYLRLKRATVMIQSAFRGLQQRQRYCILRRVVISTQALVRCNQTQGRFLRLRQAAVEIQSAFRGLQQRRRYCLLRRVVISTQALVRCNQTQLCFLRLKQTAVVIQRRYRANELCRQTQYEYVRVKQATLLIQSAFRGLQQRRRYRLVRRVVISVQALVRCNQTQRRFLRVRQAALVIQRRYRANELSRQMQHEYLRVKQATLLIQSAFRGLQQRRRYHLVRRVVISMQALVRMKQQRRNYTELRETVVRLQYRIKSNMATARARREFLTKRSAVLRIQASYRRYVQEVTAAVLIQRRFRAMHDGSVIRKDFLRLKSAALILQAAFRGYRGRRVCGKVRAVLVIQTGFRGLIARRRVQRLKEQRHARLLRFSAAALHHMSAVRIQRFYRRACAMALARVKIKSVMFVQWWWRGVLQRRRFLALRCSAVILQRSARRRLQIKHQAATKIQALARVIFARDYVKKMQASALYIQKVWRGYKARCHVTSVKVKRARRRIEAANAAATEPMKLCNRTRSALDYLLRCKNLTTIFNTLVNLEVVTRLSYVCCEQLVQDHALNVIYTVIRNCNRSLPHMEIIKYAVSILINVAKWPSTSRAVYDEEPEVVGTLLELMCNFRDKGPIFSKTCYLLTVLSRDRGIKEEILNTPKALEKIRGVHALTERKYKLEAKRNKFKSSVAGKPSNLAPPTPCKYTARKASKSDWTTMWQDHVNTTRDPLEAATALVRALDNTAQAQ